MWITYPNAQSAPVSEEDIAAVALVALTTDKLLNQAVGLSDLFNHSTGTGRSHQLSERKVGKEAGGVDCPNC